MERNIIIHKLFFILFSIALISCSGNKINDVKSISKSKADSIGNPLKRCILEKDTIFDNGNSIRYVVFDSFYTVQIKLNGEDTLLPYQFNCSVPRGLVPSFHSFYNNIICLIRGYGFNYRAFTICYNDSDQIVIKDYETALATDLRNDIVVYQDTSNSSNIIIQKIHNEQRKIIQIPKSFQNTNVVNTEIKGPKVIINFADGKLFLLKK